MPYLDDLVDKISSKDLKGFFSLLPRLALNKETTPLDDDALASGITGFDAALTEAGTAKSRHLRILNDLLYIVANNAALKSLDAMLDLPLVKAQLESTNHVLHELMTCYHPAVVTRLLKTGKFDVNYENKDFCSLLCTLARRGDSNRCTDLLETFDLLIAAGANVNFTLLDGSTILSCAGDSLSPLCNKILENPIVAVTPGMSGELKALILMLDKGQMTEAVYSKFLDAYETHQDQADLIFFPLLIADKLQVSVNVKENNKFHDQGWEKMAVFLNSPQCTDQFKMRLAKAL